MAGLVLDPEKLLWKPGAKLISIPKARQRSIECSHLDLELTAERFTPVELQFAAVDLSVLFVNLFRADWQRSMVRAEFLSPPSLLPRGNNDPICVIRYLGHASPPITVSMLYDPVTSKRLLRAEVR